MDRRITASTSAAIAAAVLLGAAVQEVLTSTDPIPVDVALYGLGVLISVAVPVTGAVLVARRRAEGLAVLVTAALIALPAIASLGYFLASASTSGGSGGPGRQTATTALYLVAQVAMVAAGAAAWGLRDADRWRWDRRVRAPYVALAVVALLPTGASLVTLHGVFFPVAMLVSLNVLDVAMLAQAVVFVALLVLAARLPRRTAAVLLLVLLVPRLYESVAQTVRQVPGVEMGRGPVDWFGMAAVAVLIATACWWLARTDHTSVGTDPAPRDGSVTR